MNQTHYTIHGINGPVVKVTGGKGLAMMDMVSVGEEGLIGEVVSVDRSATTVQVYEDTAGLKPGQPVVSQGAPMAITLGPGMLTNIFDGIARPLKVIEAESGPFIGRGLNIPSLDQEKTWDVTLHVKAGDVLAPGALYASCPETPLIVHRCLVPTGVSGRVTKVAPAGAYRVSDTLVELTDDHGQIHPLALAQRWPIRTPRPIAQRLPIDRPLVTGQRIIDTLFPIGKGGAAAIPGPFGAGKTMTQHQLAKWSDADIIVYLGCGERGNEMTQALEEFSELLDPKSQQPLMNRTILIANTSNMPVAAREASVYTGMTIAEYYRDMGYHVALMADSTSRWAEALREMSGRLEEMPGEEGYPAYLSSRLAQFYERAGMVECIGSDGHRRGSLTAVGAVSPPGGDLSEPVSQATMRIVKVFWALDASLAYKRHFPAINWLNSYSLYLDSLKPWYDEHLGPQFMVNRDKAMSILQEEASLNEIVQLVGKDSLSAADQLTLETAKMLREDFLQQNGFMEVDWYSSYERQDKMIQMILDYDKLCRAAIEKGAATAELFAIPFREQMGRAKSVPDDRYAAVYADMAREMEEQIADIAARGGAEE